MWYNESAAKHVTACLPCNATGAGRVRRWRVPATAGFFDHRHTIRVDSGVREGDDVGTNYDPMIAKLITKGRDRAEALQAMRQALADVQVWAYESW